MCFKRNEAVWDIDLRRVGKISRMSNMHYAGVDCTVYDVRAGDHQNETSCSSLRGLDPRTEVGRHNLKVVEKIEKLMGQLRSVADDLSTRAPRFPPGTEEAPLK